MTVVDDDCFDVTTDAGTHFRARCVFVAGGVGSFQPRKLRFEAEILGDIGLDLREAGVRRVGSLRDFAGGLLGRNGRRDREQQEQQAGKRLPRHGSIAH